MAYQNDLRNPRAHDPRTPDAPGTPLGTNPRPAGGSGRAGLILGVVVLLLVVGIFAFGRGDDGTAPAGQGTIPAQTETAPDLAAPPAAPADEGAAPAPVAPAE
ncbi:hypothetical protein C4N9_18005 [Pararhodobacter marinus]|uniref:Uncharacterized protein n=1 Tax=Pararhodobacter marinus TaxID=2184063 RepID=A0A2U2C5M9_9RHOB|nr:hypothetical protein [Pararhodobacter marinus]PWE27198.1 hypothetical protein C4N9_18005 [Pararhodobacter marinus]